MSRKIAVVDMAGTTVRDTGVVERSIRTAVVAVSGRLPADFDHVFAHARGGSKMDMLASLVGPESAHRAHRTFEQGLLREVEGGALSPLPMAVEALELLRDGGYRVALATGFSAKTRAAVIDSLGWSRLIDLALSPEDAGRGRPFPDLPLTAFLRLAGQDVRDLAVVGDTASDLHSGWRSGARLVVGVLTGAHDEARLRGAPHTHVLADVAAFARLATHGEAA